MVENEKKKIIKFQLTITLILTLIVCITSATYAYYSVSDTNNNTITGNMATVNLSLSVEKILPTTNSNNTGVMVPQLSNNNALESALKGGCVDGNTNIACQVYKIIIENRGGSATQVVNGYTYFYSDAALTQDVATAIPNLKWRLVDTVNEITPNQSVLGNNSNNPANANGENKLVSNLTMTTNSIHTYYMIVWVNETNEDQPIDVNKEFYGKIEFESSNGSGVTAVFGNTKPAIDDTEYTVTFDPNGGTVSTPTKQVTINQKYGSLPTPTRSGYTFKGWNGKNKFDETKYYFVEDYNIQDNSYYYASPIELNYNTNYYVSISRQNNYDGKNHNILLISNSSFINSNWTAIAHNTQPDFSQSNFRYNTTTNSNLLYVGRYTLTKQSDLDYIWSNTNVQIEEGTQATEYEPYYITSDTKVTQKKNHTLTAIWEENS